MKKIQNGYKIITINRKEAPIAPKDDKLRINDEIKVKEVRLISEEGEQLGIVPLEEALSKATQASLDLVEISPNADPPVCKIIDYGKYLYQKAKKAKEAKKNQKTVEIKEMKFGPKIDDHDFSYRMKRILQFLEKGDKVKVTVRFRGREMSHTELGYKIIDKVLAEAESVSTVEKRPKLEGKNLSMVLAPNKK